jgi:hypothetical protein
MEGGLMLFLLTSLAGRCCMVCVVEAVMSGILYVVLARDRVSTWLGEKVVLAVVLQAEK